MEENHFIEKKNLYIKKENDGITIFMIIMTKKLFFIFIE